MREAHGLASNRTTDKAKVLAIESATSISLGVDGFWTTVTPDEARYLARVLRRMARRIDNGWVK